MEKRRQILMTIGLTFLLTIFSLTGFSQKLPVNQTQEQKKAVIEEFTGYRCSACPYGHRSTNQYKAACGDSVIVINIHAGNYDFLLFSQRYLT